MPCNCDCCRKIGPSPKRDDAEFDASMKALARRLVHERQAVELLREIMTKPIRSDWFERGRKWIADDADIRKEDVHG